MANNMVAKATLWQKMPAIVVAFASKGHD